MPILAFFALAPEALAIEAAAATAAEVAAAEAAAALAAEAAATEAAAAAAAQAAAQQTAQAGIMEIGGTTAANTGAPLTAETVQNAAMQSGLPAAPEVINTAQGLPQGFEEQLQNIQNMSQGPSVQVASANPTAGLDALNNQPVFQSGQGLPSAQTYPVSDGGIASVPPAAPPANTLPMGIDMPGTYMPPSNALYTPPPSTYTAPPSALESGFDKALKFADKHPFPAMALAYTGANALGLLNPSGNTFNEKEYDGPLNRYRLSPDFKPGSANPEDYQYTPRRYAEGGIMGTAPNTISVGYEQGGQMPEPQNYAKGGSLSESIESYQKMLSGKPMAPPARSADVGIYYDQDPDTRYQDALTAAQIRQAKVNQRAYVSPPAAKRPTPMGQLQMASVKPRKQGDGGGDVEAARGGIMHSGLGGYAAGGNPRLLRGPGDGMSDNIPATINGRQPARLADGEFVIPADVVSHLGNGSTEAGAKQLHAMMDKVRSARTGNKKQGRQIKPQKYMPK